MAAATDLWPDFKIEAPPRGMRQMLEDAGAGIGEKTNGLIEFVVLTRSATPYGSFSIGFVYDCLLRVPKVDYQYLLLRVETGATPFPAIVFPPEGKDIPNIRDEEELRKVLANIFGSDSTRELIRNLIANFG